MACPTQARVLVTASQLGKYHHLEAPGLSLQLELNAKVAEQLHQEAVNALHSVTSRGSEIGCLLLGRFEFDTGRVVIEDYEPVPCSYHSGPLYKLDEGDRRRLREAIARHRSDTGAEKTVVGYFRSNTRKRLELDEDDLALIREYLSDPVNVFLLLKPGPTSTGALFCWQGNDVPRQSVLVFSWPSAATGANSPEQTPKANEASDARLTHETSRREAPSLDQGTQGGAPGPDPDTIRALVDEVLAETARRRGSSPAASTGDAIQAQLAAKPGVNVSGTTPSPEAARASTTSLARRLRSCLLWPVLAGCLLVVTAGVLWERLFGGQADAPHTSQRLALRVEAAGEQLLLSWDRSLPLLQRAERGVLSVTDGEYHREIEIDRAGLLAGSIIYAPLSSDVSFRLMVHGAGKAQTVSESVRVVGMTLAPRRSSATVSAVPGATPSGSEAELGRPAQISGPLAAAYR